MSIILFTHTGCTQENKGSIKELLIQTCQDELERPIKSLKVEKYTFYEVYDWSYGSIKGIDEKNIEAALSKGDKFKVLLEYKPMYKDGCIREVSYQCSLEYREEKWTVLNVAELMGICSIDEPL